MKVARLAVLGIAVLAGGGAAWLAGRSDAPPPPPPPVVTISTVDVLIARKDINIGQAIQTDDMGWAAWPTDSVNPLDFDFA